MTEVLLGSCYYLRFDPKLWEAMQPYPPLGTLYAASCVRSRGFSVALFDSILATSNDDWQKALQAHTPRFAVIYEDSFNYLSKMCLLRMRQAAFEMIRAARNQGCTVIVSSSDATDHVQEYQDQGAHYILIGEGEVTLAELLESLSGRSNKPLSEVSGLPGNPPREPLRDLDQLPFPAWDLVDVARYRTIWKQRHGYYSVNMVTTRGCPYHCNWCAKPIYGQRYNSRTPLNVVEELAWLKECVQPDHVWFADDILGLKKGWIERFSRLICERKLQIPFKCLLRADLVDEEISSQLRQAGCQSVWMGVESGSQKILDAMEKGMTVEHAQLATRHLRKAGIQVGYFLQFGYPGEEWQDICQTLDLVRRCRPDDIGVSVSYPLPGTSFYERVRSQLGEKQNWFDSADLALLYGGRYVPDFYRHLHRALHKEFRARRAWSQLRRGRWRALLPLLRGATLPWDRLQLRILRSAHNGGATF